VPDILNYGTPLTRTRRQLAGIFSLLLVVLQPPWLFLVFMLTWGCTDLDLGGAFCLTAALLPTIFAVPLGVYSVWSAGVRRNRCGVLSLAVVALEVVAISARIMWIRGVLR
jgi:hypothetical protein